MESAQWAPQPQDIIESEIRDEAATDVELAPLVEKVGAKSLAEIERTIGQLQEARDFLQSEGERVQRETEQYTTLTQMASASVKIISDTVARWREAGHPLRSHSSSSQLEITPSPSENNPGSLRVPDEQSPQSDGLQNFTPLLSTRLPY
jgi:hypothetical protein